jgi:hypothetical protein
LEQLINKVVIKRRKAKIKSWWEVVHNPALKAGSSINPSFLRKRLLTS